MKRALTTGAVLAGAFAVVSLSGCSAIPTLEPAARVDVVDQQRVAAVERIANRTGTRVFWINPPTVKLD